MRAVLPGPRRLSISAKINLSLVIVFLLVMGVSAVHTVETEQALIESVIEQQTSSTAEFYFDALNTMMVTGTMDQRSVLREKVLARPGIIDARVIRSAAVNELFGRPAAGELPADEWDELALQGRAITRITQTPAGRVLTVVRPVRASTNYRNTNCLACHTNARPGDVLGAVRIAYSLETLDGQVHDNLASIIGIQVAVVVAGFSLIIWVLRKVVLRPIASLRATMAEVERTSNLNIRVDDLCRKDQFGGLAGAFNRMMERFQGSLHTVARTAREQREIAERISGVSDETARKITEQRNETRQVARAVAQLNEAVGEVARNAAETAAASDKARGEAQSGALIATTALGSMESIVKSIKSVEEAIEKLGTEAENITEVLDVIKGIADQTNLLALNAAIEAARAGECGRGFSVVADEVRALAARSQESADKIQAMIAKLQARTRRAVQAMHEARCQANDGSGKVEQTAESLAAISAEVTGINGRNTQIAAAAEEQSAVVQDVNQNVSRLDDLMDKNSEHVRRVAEDCAQVLRLAVRLEGLVAEFGDAKDMRP